MSVDIVKLKCPHCGATQGIEEHGKWYFCSSCYGQFYVASKDIQIRLMQAYNYRVSYRFDEADELYSAIAREMKNVDNEAYVTAEWGRLLSYFGVVYIKSFSGGAMTPTFTQYHSNISSIKDVEYYSNIMSSDISLASKDAFESQANVLDDTYTRIEAELAKKPKYDVFICTKISARTEDDPDNRGIARDKGIADNLYAELKSRHLKVFYSDQCCSGIEYDSQIFSALLRSKTILVIATEKDYLESQWVESEWRRWLEFIREGKKGKNSIFLYLPDYNTNAFAFPVVLNNAQYFTSDNLSIMENLIVSAAKNKLPNVAKKPIMVRQSTKLSGVATDSTYRAPAVTSKLPKEEKKSYDRSVTTQSSSAEACNADSGSTSVAQTDTNPKKTSNVFGKIGKVLHWIVAIIFAPLYYFYAMLDDHPILNGICYYGLGIVGNTGVIIFNTALLISGINTPGVNLHMLLSEAYAGLESFIFIAVCSMLLAAQFVAKIMLEEDCGLSDLIDELKEERENR